jgi:hypothetical protein
MPTSSKQLNCAHPGCICEARGADSYCSDYCKTAMGDDEHSCACGHPGCGVHLDQHPESLEAQETPFIKILT